MRARMNAVPSVEGQFPGWRAAIMFQQNHVSREGA